MTERHDAASALPPQQRAIHARCVHPSGTFVEFESAEIEQSIPERFERQVRTFPDRMAVESAGSRLTYAELHASANAIAGAVVAELGQGRGLVALLLGHGAPAIASVLGTLKAGKIYVPLDPSQPQALLARTLEESHAALIVTDDDNRPLADGLARNTVPLINIDRLGSPPADQGPARPVSPDVPALVMYTSGSTGRPKGVVHSHRSILHEIMNYTNYLHIGAEDRLSLLRPISVFGPVRQLFGALLNGATLSIFDLKKEGIGHLASWLAEEEITIYRSVPTIFRHLVETLRAGVELPKLRALFLTGEAIRERDVEHYKEFFSQECVFVSGLGSTETLAARWYPIDKNTPIVDGVVPVGYPVEGKQLELVDDDGLAVGEGRVGEIIVRSRYLSSGYWRRPELTEAVFSSDPDGGDERTYRTGDLGRMLPDGCLLYVGRKGSQVKIRGYKVEVADVESALVEQEAVREAVVVSRPDPRGDDRLVAYVVPAQERQPTVGELRLPLAEQLPRYMIPTAFVIMEGLPRTASGKIDRLALPEPGRARPQLDGSLTPPRTPIEQSLGRIWSELLGIEGVGVHDGFLDLGGDSVLAMQIISRVIDTFRVELPLKTLFESPTIAEMAVVVAQHLAQEASELEVGRMLSEVEHLFDQRVERPSPVGD